MLNEYQVKAAVRERDGVCVKCGMTNEEHRERFGTQLHVHRKRPGSRYTLRGCVALCRPCHGPQPKSLWGSKIPGSFTLDQAARVRRAYDHLANSPSAVELLGHRRFTYVGDFIKACALAVVRKIEVESAAAEERWLMLRRAAEEKQAERQTFEPGDVVRMVRFIGNPSYGLRQWKGRRGIVRSVAEGHGGYPVNPWFAVVDFGKRCVRLDWRCLELLPCESDYTI